MYEKELFSIKDMLKIEDEKFSIILDRNYKKNKKAIIETIAILNSQYENNIYYITSPLLLSKEIFKEINTYPSLLLFSKGKEEPDYFLPGVLK